MTHVRRRRPAYEGMSTVARALLLINAVEPLLEMYAACDDVFTEDDAFSEEHIQQSLGRIYRAWKRTRKDMDPDFDQESVRRPRHTREN